MGNRSPAPVLPVGGAVSAAHLVGRDTLVEQLAEWLVEGFRVVLTGPRRSGKSTVAVAAARRVSGAGVPVAVVDVARCLTLRGVAEAIFSACAERLPDVPSPDIAGRTPEEAFAAALNWPETVAVAGDVAACAVILDGCEHLERLGGVDTLLSARPGLARQQHVGYLFVGVHTLALTRLTGTRSAPFALPVGVQPPRHEAWLAYIRSQLAALGPAPTDAGLARLLERTGGYPFDVMAICRVAALRRGRAPRALTREGVDRAVQELGPLLAPLLLSEATALGPTKYGILQRLAADAHIYREAGPPASIKRAVDELVAAGMLRRARRGRYTFTEPLLAEALRAELG